MTGWLFDFGSAWRALRATRGASILAILTLALGTGASTAVLGPVYSAVVGPLPFRDPDRLFLISTTFRPSGLSSTTTLKLDELRSWRDRFAAADRLAGYTIEPMTIRGNGPPRSVSVGIAAGDLFAELGAPMLAGRAFTEDDPPDAVVISQNLAWRLAGRDVSRAVGRDLVVGDRARRVTGVLPPSFDIFAGDVELWLPAAGVAPLMTFGKSDVRSYHAIVRLADGVPVASARDQFVEELVRRVRALPGVAAAGVGSNLPPAEPHMIFTIRVTTDDSRVDQTRAFDFVSATDGYLDALGTTVEQGRTLNEGDRLADRPVAVLSETTARFLAPIGPVLNRRLTLGLPTSKGIRVQPYAVGVVADVRYNGLDKSGRGSVYVPWRQLPMATGYLVVRTMREATSVAPAVLRVARDIDPTLPLDAPRTLEEEIQHSLAPRSTRVAVIGGFAAVALMLAIVGLSSALIRRVIEGRRDLAIRIALGATPGRAIHFVVARGLWLSLTGLALGTGTALLAARAFSALVVGVSPYDPATYIVIAAGIVVVALGACYLPARRAASVDAIELLRAG
ncbi:MAG TPA: ABC transporter permease [Gemmatimonadaceae bacterium]